MDASTMTGTNEQIAPLLRAGSQIRVLVVDDEAPMTELLSTALGHEGWDVRTAASGNSAIRTAQEFRPDLVVLDMMLPDLDGLDVLRRLREHTPELPVLFLTARDAIEDRIAGLDAGADDYLTKPFSLQELLGRLHSVLRRSGTLATSRRPELVVGDLVLDEDGREVHRAGTRIELSPVEFDLLRYLMHNPRQVVSESQILDQVWKFDFGGQATVVELYIGYLRKKIDTDHPPMIHTVRGLGYVLQPPPHTATDEPPAVRPGVPPAEEALGSASGM